MDTSLRAVQKSMVRLVSCEFVAAEEEETDDGRLFLRLKDGTKLRATGSLNDSQ